MAAMLIALARAARAGPLDGPKAAGQIGERWDGYLGLVDSNAPASVRQLVERTNREREARYAEIAARRGVATADVAAIAGAKLVNEAPPGQFVMGPDGRWVRR
jgi:uncharacterized protein YdbL (DUF1318 family)